MENLASELGKVPLLKDLSEKELEELAGMARLQRYRHGEVVMEEGSQADFFYVVLSGLLRTRTLSEGKHKVLNQHSKGDFVGENAMLTGGVRAATIDVIEDAEMALFDKTAFSWLIERPEIKTQLESKTKQWQRELTFPGRREDEHVLVLQGRHIFALVERAFIPLLLMILFLVLVEMIDRVLEVSTATALTSAAPVLVIALAMAVYFYIDWSNDHFIVTSKRIIHFERILFYGESRDEAPLEHVQDVKLDRPNFIYKLLGFHNVEVKTAGAGSFFFSKAANGEQIKDAIFAARDKIKLRRSATEKETIRQELRQQLGIEKKTEIISIEAEDGGVKPTGHLLGPLDYFVPRVRTVDAESNQITWRKHWLILLRRTFLPLILCPTSLALLIISLMTTPWQVALLLFFFLLFTIAWLFWKYEDWRNDIYVVTSDKILDIKRSPFGLRGESRRTGTFDSLQDVTYKIPSFLHKLLNLGNVYVKTTGQVEPFQFSQVFDPSSVQQEIFDRLVKYQQRREQSERLKNIRDLALWFGQYQVVTGEMGQKQEQ